MYVAKDQRGKLDLKTWPCIFLGYGNEEFVYRLQDLAEKKVIRKRDIIFMEEKMIVNREIENKPPATESRQVDAWSN